MLPSMDTIRRSIEKGEKRLDCVTLGDWIRPLICLYRRRVISDKQINV